MDEVLADTLGKQLRCYNDRYRANVTHRDLRGQELVDIVLEHARHRVQEMLHACWGGTSGAKSTRQIWETHGLWPLERISR
jgi:hypothetical protein